jgi:hypothetical protein
MVMPARPTRRMIGTIGIRRKSCGAPQQRPWTVFGKPILLDLPGSNFLTFPLSRLRFRSRPVDSSGKGGH